MGTRHPVPWVLAKSISCPVPAGTWRPSAPPRVCPVGGVTWGPGGRAQVRAGHWAFPWALEPPPRVSSCRAELSHLDVSNRALQPGVSYDISHPCLVPQVLQTSPRIRCPQHTVTWVSVCLSGYSLSLRPGQVAGVGRGPEGEAPPPTPHPGPVQPIRFLVTGILGSPPEWEAWGQWCEERLPQAGCVSPGWR